MNWTLVLLIWCWFQLVHADPAPSDQLSDPQPDEDLGPDPQTDPEAGGLSLGKRSRGVLGPNVGSNWDLPDINQDHYEDADWHPPPSLLETHYNLHPEARARPGVREEGDQSPAALCGEFSSQLTPGGQCRLTATLPAVSAGASQKRCPDMFRCTDDISSWLHENHNRKEQLEELRETTSELQEELRSHQHRVRTLETQANRNVRLNVTFDPGLRSLDFHGAQMDTLLHVHHTLLQQLQAQVRNLSAAAQHADLNTGCRIKVIRAPSLLSMRDTLPPDGRHLSLCPSDCASLYHNGVRRSGVYSIVVSPGSSQQVYCDMKTEGGGWTVVQRRRDGSVDFNRGWLEYRDGFGEPRGEYWLGNQQLHLLSNQGHYSLRINLQDWSNAHKHAQYHSFRIQDEENRYRLHVSGFSGTVKDSFSWYHDQQSFSTPDTGNICAEISHAGWWFHQCFYANLNGVYYKGGHYSLKAQNLLGPDGIVWFSWRESDFYSLKAVTMMIRPSSFRPSSSP
ncbi:angiopoietin-2-like [Halichoeres trimaculatus]|uniref:angiopoietin-2-like n=1 Tax=Halichoeres trimaculatus TaxID=147232 RepID=UPI003D9E983C